MKETPFWYHLLWGLALIIFKLFFRIRIYGRENIPSRGGVILAANHLSYLDPIILGLLTPRKMNYMAKEELFKKFLFRLLIERLGAFPLKRDRIDRSAYEKAISLLQEGRVLALFPEGTRGRRGKLGYFKKGVSRIALKTGVPIVPVIIRGTDEALPKGRKMIKLARIEVRVGKPLRTEGFSRGKDSKKKIDDLCEELRKRMAELGALR